MSQFVPFTWSDATDAERVAMLTWYARQLSQTLRDQAEFPGEHETQSSIDAKRYAAYHVDKVVEEWQGKWTGWTNQHKPEWAAQFERS